MLLNTRVTRILPVDSGDNHKRDNGPNFRKVEFATSAQGQRLSLFMTIFPLSSLYQPLDLH